MSSDNKRFWALAIVGEFFPDFDEWLRRTQNRGRYMEAAQEVFDNVSPAAVEKACKRLLQGEPVRHSRLPFVVAELAKKIVARMEANHWRTVADGHETMRCRECQDTGLIEILHPKTVAECLASRQLPAFPYTAVALCPCAAGQAKREMWLRADRQHRIDIIFYNQQRHIRRELGALPIDQYRQLLGGKHDKRDVAISDSRSPRRVAADLAEKTRIDNF
jgi:hypothetical protein